MTMRAGQSLKLPSSYFDICAIQSHIKKIKQGENQQETNKNNHTKNCMQNNEQWIGWIWTHTQLNKLK